MPLQVDTQFEARLDWRVSVFCKSVGSGALGWVEEGGLVPGLVKLPKGQNKNNTSLNPYSGASTTC